MVLSNQVIGSVVNKSKKSDKTYKDIERARKKFQHWRSQKSSNDRIPEELWDLALNLTKNHPVGRVASRLALDYCHLKALKQKQTNFSSKEFNKSPFIRLNVSESDQSLSLSKENCDCIMEFFISNGNRIKIYSSALKRIDFKEIFESFLDCR